MGVPLTLVLTPFFYADTIATAEVVNHFSPAPPEFWQSATHLAKLVSRVLNAAMNYRGVLDPQEVAISLALWLLPGIGLAWLAVGGRSSAFPPRRRGRHCRQPQRART
jgi:hypothetical protein